ncbi:hypothetical protein FHG87_014402 [Trinorchestia longiramus]|nr:hypothetical protein FHG87_014402 [Trinorchestia longiramus]
MADEDEPQWWERQPEATADVSTSHSSTRTDTSDVGKQLDTNKTKERGAFRAESSSGFVSGCSEGEEASHPMNVYERDIASTMDPRPSSSTMMYNPPMISSHLGYLPHYPYGANSSFRQPYYSHMPNMIPNAGQPHMQGQYISPDPQHGIPPNSHSALHSRDGDFFGMESDGYGLRSMRVPVDHLSNKFSRTDLGKSQRPPSPQAMQPGSYGPSSVGHPTAGPSHGPYYPNNSAGVPGPNFYAHMPLSAHRMPQYSDISMPPTPYDSYPQPPYGPSQYPYSSPHFPPYAHPNFGRDFGATPPPPRFPLGPDYYPPMHSTYIPRQPYPESPSRSIYRQSPHFFDVPSHQTESHSTQQMRDESSNPSKEYREEGNRRQRPTFFQKKREKDDCDNDITEQVEDTLSSDDKLNFISSTRRKSGNRRKCSVLSADSLENVVGSPVSPMTPSTPLSPEYKELSSTSSSAPFSPTPPPSPAQGAIPKHSDSRQAVEAAKDLNHKVAALFRDVERVNTERRQEKNLEASDESRSGRSSVNQSASRLSASSSCDRSSEVAELDKSENEHDVTRDSNESQYDNVSDSFPRIAPFPPADSQSLNKKEEAVTAFRCDSPRVGDVGFVRATLDTPQTLLASTRLVQATLKPSPKPTTFFIALESKFVMPDFTDSTKSPDDKKDKEDEDLLKSTPETDGTIDKSTEEDRDLSIEQDSLMEDFSRDAKAINTDASSISPDNVSVSPADYHESQLVMKHFVQNWDEINSEKVPEDLDEFFLVLDCDGTASQYHFLSGSTSPRSSSSESFYKDDELDNYQQNLVSPQSVDKCEEPEKKPRTYQPMATMLEEEEDLKTSIDLSLNSDVSTLPSPSQPLQVKCSTPMQRDPVPSASAVSPEIPHFSTLATAIKSSITRNTNILGDALSKLHRSGEELSVPVLLGSSKSADSSKIVTASDPKPKSCPLPDQIQPSTEQSDERLSKPTSSGTKSLLQSFLGSGKSFARPSPPRVALGSKPIVKPNSTSGKSPSDDDTKLNVGGKQKLSPKLALPTFQTNVNFIFINTRMDAKKSEYLSTNFSKMQLTSKETKLTCFPNRESVKKRLFPEKNNNSSNCENIQLKKELSVCLPKKSSKIPVKKFVFRSVSEGSRYEENNDFKEIEGVYDEKTSVRNVITDNSTHKSSSKLNNLCAESNSKINEKKNESIQRTHDKVTAANENSVMQNTNVRNSLVSEENALCLSKENASCETRRNWGADAVDELQVDADQSEYTTTTDTDHDPALVASDSKFKLEATQEDEQVQRLTSILNDCPGNSVENPKAKIEENSIYSSADKGQAIKPKQKSKSQSSIPTLKQPRVLFPLSGTSSNNISVQRNVGPAVGQPPDVQQQPQLKQPQKTLHCPRPLASRQQKVSLSDWKGGAVQNSLLRSTSEERKSSLSKVVVDSRQGACFDFQKFEAKKKVSNFEPATVPEIVRTKFGFEECTELQGDGIKSDVNNRIKSASSMKHTSIPIRKDITCFSTPKKVTENRKVLNSSNLGANLSEICIVECTKKVDLLDMTECDPTTSSLKKNDSSTENVNFNVIVSSRSLPSISEEYAEWILKKSSSLSKLDLWSNVRDELVSKLLLSFVKEMNYLESVNSSSYTEKTKALNEDEVNKSAHQSLTLKYNQRTLQASKLWLPRNPATHVLPTEPTSVAVLPPTVANHSPGACRDLKDVAEGSPCSDDPFMCPVTVASCAMDVGSPPLGSSVLNSQKPITHHATVYSGSKGNMLPLKSNTNHGAHVSPSMVEDHFQEVHLNNESLSQAIKPVSSSCSSGGGTVVGDTGTLGAASSALAREVSVVREALVPLSVEPAPVEQCSRSVFSRDLTSNDVVYSSDTFNANLNSSGVTSESERLQKIEDKSLDFELSRNSYNHCQSFDSIALIHTSKQEVNSDGHENLTKDFTSDDASSNDSGRGGFTIYTNRYIETSDVEISDDNISDFSDEEIVLSVSSEDLSDSKEDISEPLFIPSLSGTKLDYEFGEKLLIGPAFSEASADLALVRDRDKSLSTLNNSCNRYNTSHIQENFTETSTSPVFAKESRAVALDLVSQALQSSSINGAMEGLPFLKREELDRLATIIANKLLQSNPNSLATSVTSTDDSAEPVVSTNIFNSTKPHTNSAHTQPVIGQKSGDTSSVECENHSTNYVVEKHPNLPHPSYSLSLAASHSSSPPLSVITEPISTDIASEKYVYNLDSNCLDVDSSLSPSGSIGSSAVSKTDSNCGTGTYLTTVDGPASVSSGDSICVSSGYSVSSSDSGVSVNSSDNKITSGLDSASKKDFRVYSEQIVACNFNDITQSPSKVQDISATEVVVKLPEIDTDVKGIEKMQDRTGFLGGKRAVVVNERGSDPTCLRENLAVSTEGNNYTGTSAVVHSRACVIQGNPAEHVALEDVSDCNVALTSLTSGNLSVSPLQSPVGNYLKTASGENTLKKFSSQEHHGAKNSRQERNDVFPTTPVLKTKTLATKWVPNNGAFFRCEDRPSLEGRGVFHDLAKEGVVCKPGVKSLCCGADNLEYGETCACSTSDNNSVLPIPAETRTSLACYGLPPKSERDKNPLLYSAATMKSQRTSLDCFDTIRGQSNICETFSPHFVQDGEHDNACPTGDFACTSSSTEFQLQSSQFQNFSKYSPASLTELAARAHKHHLVQVYRQHEKIDKGKSSRFDAHFCSSLAVPGCLNQEDNIDSGFESVTKLSSFSSSDCEPRHEQSFIVCKGDAKNVSSHQSHALESTNVVHERQSAGIKLNKREQGLAQVSLGAQVTNRGNRSYDGNRFSLGNQRPMLKSEPWSMSMILKEKSDCELLTKTAVRKIKCPKDISSTYVRKEGDSALENESNSHQLGCAFTDEQTELCASRQCSIKGEAGEADSVLVRSNVRLQCGSQQEVLIENFPIRETFSFQNEHKIPMKVPSEIHHKRFEDFSSSHECEEDNEEENSSSITSTIRIPMVIGKCEGERLKVLSSDHYTGKLAAVETEGKNDFSSVVDRNSNDVTKVDKNNSVLNCREYNLTTTKERCDSIGIEEVVCTSTLSVCNLKGSEINKNCELQKMDAKNSKISSSRKSPIIDLFPKMKDYHSLRQKNYDTTKNFVSILERSREELDKSDESFEEVNWEIENDRIRKTSYERDKPDRKISDSSGVSSLSNSSYRKLSSSSNVSSPGDDWHWFPGRKNGFHCEQISRKISTASSGCSSGISSLQEIQDNRRISVCSGISNLQRIREESSSHFSESSSSEGDLNLLDDKAESPDGVLPTPPPPVWPTFTNEKPPKPPRRSTLGIVYDNNTVRFDELQVRNCNSLKRDKRISKKRDRRRTLHTFNNIFDEWHQKQCTESGLSGSLEIVRPQNVKGDPIKSSSEAGLLDGKDDMNSFEKCRNECGTSPSLIGAYDSGESVELFEVASTRKIGYFEDKDTDSDDSDCTGKMYSIGVQNSSHQFSNEKTHFKRRGVCSIDTKRPQLACNDEIDRPLEHSDLKNLVSRDARSLPNLSDVGEANVLDDPVIPERKIRKNNHSVHQSNFEVLKPKVRINRSEFNISELHTAAERLQGRVKHALSDDAILEKGYAEYSGSEHESDMEDLNMQFFEPKSKLRLVSKSLKREAPPAPSLVRASRIRAPTDGYCYTFDNLSHSSSGTSHNGHNLSNSTSFNSAATSSSKNSFGAAPEGFSVTRTYKKVSEVRHYEPRSLNGSESSYSWDDADSDFEYFKVSPGTVLVSLEPGRTKKFTASGVAQGGGSLGRRDGFLMTRSLSEPPELPSPHDAYACEPVTAGMLPSGVYRSERPAGSSEIQACVPGQVAPSSPPSDVLAWILQQNSMH